MGGAENLDWPVLTEYDQDHLARIALPLGGIGTGIAYVTGFTQLHSVVTDALNDLAEVNENNNLAKITIQVLAP